METLEKGTPGCLPGDWLQVLLFPDPLPPIASQGSNSPHLHLHNALRCQWKWQKLKKRPAAQEGCQLPSDTSWPKRGAAEVLGVNPGVLVTSDPHTCW